MIKKLFGIVDYFLPPEILEESDLTSLFRLRAIVLSGLLGLVIILLLLLTVFVMKMSLVPKVSSIVAFLCVLFFLIFSKSLKKGHAAYFEIGAQFQIVLINLLIYLSTTSQKGMGIFGLIWIIPVVILTPFYFKRKYWIINFIINAIIITSIICLKYNTFFLPIERIEYFREVYIFYLCLVLLNSGLLAFLFIQLNDLLREEVTKQKEVIHENAKFQSLGQMASNLAHDINNPLFTIQGKMHQIRNLLSEDELNLERCDVIIEDVENIILKLSQIVKGVSTFARQNNRDSMIKTKISELIKGVILLSADRFKQYEINFETHIDESIILNCYPSYLTQILLNLLNNAIDAVEHASNKMVRLEVTKSDRHVEFYVIDSGSGVEPSILPEIFKPFITTKKSGKGTGLGLSISKGLAQLHKGDIEYKRVGQWTYFVVKIPYNE